MIELKFLGTKGEIEEKNRFHKYHSGLILKIDKKKWLLDFGENLREYPISLNRFQGIFLSHAHPDHAFGLKGKKFKPVVYLSAKTDKLLSEEDFPFKRKVVSGKFDFAGLKAEIFPILHSVKAPASGLILETPIGKIGYFPDVLSFSRYKNRLEGLRLYIGDGSSLTRSLVRRDEKGNIFGHASIRTQLRWLNRFNVPTAIFTHFGKEAIELGDSKTLQFLKNVAGKVDVYIARDGRIFRLNKEIEIHKINTLAAQPSSSIERLPRMVELFRLEDYDPSKATDAQLGDDFRLICAKYANMLRSKKTEFKSIQEVKDFAVLVVKELLKRGKVTFHATGPKRMKPSSLELLRYCLEKLVKRGLPLVEPHPRLIFEGKKTAIVKARKFDLSQFRILCSFKNLAFGFIRFLDPEEIDLKEFRARIQEHRIPEIQRLKWWPEKKRLYFYKIRDFIPFEVPRKIRPLPSGVQTSVRQVHLLSSPLSEAPPTFNPELFQPNVLQKLDDFELLKRHQLIHQLFVARGSRRGDELVINAHCFVVEELNKRRLPHRPKELLDKLSEEFKGTDSVKTLTDVERCLKFWQNGFYLKEPFLAFVGSTIVSGYGNDFDIWVNWPAEDEHTLGILHFKLAELLPPDLEEALHLVPDPEGRFTNSLPFARLKVEIIPPEERKLIVMSETLKVDQRIQIMVPFTPPKARAGYHLGEFFDFPSLWKFWGEPNIKHGIAVEVKYDGLRFVTHKRGKEVKIFTEDRKRDRAPIFPEVVEEIRNLPVDEVILDGEWVWWKENRPLPRHEMMHFVVGKEPLRGEDIRVNVFDCVWFNGKDLSKEPWSERQKYLKRVLPKDLKFLYRVDPIVARTREELEQAVDKVSKVLGSEGAMLKLLNSPYEIDGRMASWAKLKLVKEIDVVIIGRRKVPAALPKEEARKRSPAEMMQLLPQLLRKSRTWTYRVAIRADKQLMPIDSTKRLAPHDLSFHWDAKTLKWHGTEDPKYWEMGLGFQHRGAGEYAYGNTYNSAFEPPPKIGDIITVAPIAIREWKGVDGKTHLSWMFPIVRHPKPEKREPDSLADIRELIERQRRQRLAVLFELEEEGEEDEV